LVHIFANGDDRDWVDETLWRHRTNIQEFIDREQGVAASKEQDLT
jgi:mannose-1-phosphate guanylyltransferase/phosphomannomutase